MENDANPDESVWILKQSQRKPEAFFEEWKIMKGVIQVVE